MWGYPQKVYILATKLSHKKRQMGSGINFHSLAFYRWLSTPGISLPKERPFILWFSISKLSLKTSPLRPLCFKILASNLREKAVKANKITCKLLSVQISYNYVLSSIISHF